VGTTQNMKGEKMLDKMSARCAALSVASGDKKYIDGACVLTDADGDQIFSTFDTRDTDKSQPQMNCGTHIIAGGTGKYKGITGSEPRRGSRDEAIAAAGARIDRWLKRQREIEKKASSLPRTLRCRFANVLSVRTKACLDSCTARIDVVLPVGLHSKHGQSIPISLSVMTV